MILKTSWDDGSTYDLKLVKLLIKYKIPAIFYIPTICELSKDDIIRIYNSGIEIGAHTENHPQDLKLLSKEEQEDEILANKLYLESVIKDKVSSFCYPRGRYNEDTICILKEVGFKEARTTVAGCTDLQNDKFRVKTSVHVYPETSRFNKPDWLKEAYKLYEEAENKGDKGFFHLWGHSHELERYKIWSELEDFFRFLDKNRKLWKLFNI